MGERVALLGLGLMGSGMANNLLAAGFELSVYNRTREKADALAAAGARVGVTPAEAADGADFVISMLADDVVSRKVWLGEDGAIRTAAPGALFIESSTVTVEWIRELGEAGSKGGFDLIDAPVTGSKAQAAAGELLFLVGGTDAALDRGRAILSPMSREILHVGPTGSGALLKLINNFLCGVQVASLAQAMALIEKGGLDRQTALDVLLGGAPGSPLVKLISGRMSQRDYTPNFHLQLMMKDLVYAGTEGSRNGVDLTTASAARELFERAVVAGYGNDDMSAVIEPLRS